MLVQHYHAVTPANLPYSILAARHFYWLNSSLFVFWIKITTQISSNCTGFVFFVWFSEELCPFSLLTSKKFAGWLQTELASECNRSWTDCFSIRLWARSFMVWKEKLLSYLKTRLIQSNLDWLKIRCCDELTSNQILLCKRPLVKLGAS